MTNPINSAENIIDSRDVIARIEELESEYESLKNEVKDCDDKGREGRVADQEELENWEAENLDELNSLRELAAEAKGYCDWIHGTSLINDDYFEDYAQELAEDIGAIDRDASWPTYHIDWEAAAESLKQDYTDVEFDGVTFWMR